MQPIDIRFRVGTHTVRIQIKDGAATVESPGSPAQEGEVAQGLRDVEDSALQAAPGPAERPISVRALAKRAGYRDSGHFREAVNQLIERGLLVRLRGGIRRAESSRKLDGK